jgi:hypothetical protein
MRLHGYEALYDEMMCLPAVLQRANGTDPSTAASSTGKGVQLKGVVSWARDVQQLQNLRGVTADVSGSWTSSAATTSVQCHAMQNTFSEQQWP